MKIKVKEDGSKRLIFNDDDEIKYVIELIERDTDVIDIKNQKELLMFTTYECKCGEIISVHDKFCSNCGRRIKGC